MDDRTETMTLAEAARRTLETLPELADALTVVDKFARCERHVSCYAGVAYSLVFKGMSMGSGAVVDFARSMIAIEGQPATYNIGSDHYAGRITKVSKTGHRITWTGENGREYQATRGPSGQYRCSGGGTIRCNDDSPTRTSPEF